MRVDLHVQFHVHTHGHVILLVFIVSLQTCLFAHVCVCGPQSMSL